MVEHLCADFLDKLAQDKFEHLHIIGEVEVANGLEVMASLSDPREDSRLLFHETVHKFVRHAAIRNGPQPSVLCPSSIQSLCRHSSQEYLGFDDERLGSRASCDDCSGASGWSPAYDKDIDFRNYRNLSGWFDNCLHMDSSFAEMTG